MALSNAQSRALQELGWRDRPVSPSELAAILGCRSAHLTLLALYRRGLVTLDDEHGERYILTVKGRRRYATAGAL